MASRGTRWTKDECSVLVAIYFRARFSIGDDEHDECQLIADCFDRTPGSIDRQWRNIASVVAADGSSNVGVLIVESVREFLDDPAARTRIARSTITQRAWPLLDLLENGGTTNAFRDATETDAGNHLRVQLGRKLQGLDYCIFPGGSHGYSLEVDVGNAPTRFRAAVTCVLDGSNFGGVVKMKTTRSEMIAELERFTRRLEVKKSKNARLVIHQSTRVIVHGERFNVSVRANQLQAEKS